MRVSALSRSLKVPPERILRRKARSDAEPPAALDREKVESSDACNEDARLSKRASWDADTTDVEVAGRKGRKLNQPGVAGMSSLALDDGASGGIRLEVGRRKKEERFLRPSGRDIPVVACFQDKPELRMRTQAEQLSKVGDA